MTNVSPKEPPTKVAAFRASITLRDGRKIFAKDYGYRAFPIRSGALRAPASP
jgi:hypothetical protein